MNTGLFRRTEVSHDENTSEITREYYTDGRGIKFSIYIPEGEDEHEFHLCIDVVKPFIYNEVINLHAEDRDDALAEAAIYIKSVFDSFIETLRVTSKALMIQVGEEYE